MKQLSYQYKSGKLLKIHLNFNEEQNIIESIFITGDFFLYPEETLEEIEHNLAGATAEEEIIRDKVNRSLSNSQPFGFDAESLSAAILLCINQCRR